MSIKNFLLTTFFTILFYNLSRFIGVRFFSQTNWWIRMNNDSWHHWQLGILLIFIAFALLKNKRFVKSLFLAIGSGMIIDESMYLLYPFNNQFSHWASLGIVFEFLVFVIFVFIILKTRPKNI